LFFSNDIDDIFGSFTSATTEAASPSTETAPTPSIPGKKTTADILSLYGSAPANPMGNQFNMGNTNMGNQFGMPQQQQNQPFGNMGGFQQMPQQQQPQQQSFGMSSGMGSPMGGPMMNNTQPNMQMNMQQNMQHNQAVFMAANPFMNNNMFQQPAQQTQQQQMQQQQQPDGQLFNLGAQQSAPATGWQQQMGQLNNNFQNLSTAPPTQSTNPFGDLGNLSGGGGAVTSSNNSSNQNSPFGATPLAPTQNSLNIDLWG
jgi:hypothetical protein